MKMILGNGTELNVNYVMDCGNNTIEIEFNGHSYDEIAKIYDASYEGSEFDAASLRKIELYSDDDVLQGTHIGYTIPKSITSFNGITKVSVERESELKTEVEGIKDESLNGMMATAEIFEYVLMQDEMIALLEERIAALENVDSTEEEVVE